MFDQEKLIEFVESWLSARPSRTLGVLAKSSGVPYPTLRRLVQRENGTSLESAFAILNIVASPAEIVSFFPKSAPVMQVYEKVMKGTQQASPEVVMKLMGRDSFWIMALATTIGATHARIEKMLGMLGLAEFEKMIEDGFLQQDREAYRFNESAAPLLLENKGLAGEAVKYIAEVAAPMDFDRSKKRFAVYNVDSETFEANRADLEECYQRIDQRSRGGEGPIVMAASFVLANVFSEENEVIK